MCIEYKLSFNLNAMFCKTQLCRCVQLENRQIQFDNRSPI